jgi:Uma2 family endonuclease
MATKTRLTLGEYLAMPETKPYKEFVRGELVEKMSPNRKHARLTTRLISWLDTALEESGAGVVFNELRHVSRELDRTYLPDISVFLASTGQVDQDWTEPVSVAPDIAIEVLSPDDSAADALERADFLMKVGVRLLLIVDPERRLVFAYQPGEQTQLHHPPEMISLAPVLPDFRLDLGRLFSVLPD